MALLDLLFPRQQLTTSPQPPRKTTGIKAYSETPGVLWGRPTSSAGVEVDEFAVLSISAVFAACMRLANILAMLPLGIYEKDDTGKRTNRDSHPAGRMLGIEANPAQTAFVARHFMQFWKPLFGAACAEIGWDGAGRPRQLWPLEPWRVYPEWDDDGAMYFKVDGRRRVESDDMIYIPHVTQDGVTGKGFVDYATESMGTAIAADQAAAVFFENDMQPGGILQHPGTPAKTARDELKVEWAQRHGGVKNRRKIGVLWGGWEWVKESGIIDPDKAQLLDSRKYTVAEVARWLNVPLMWLADLSRSTWANHESEGIDVLIYSVGPLLVATEQEYDRKLLDPPRLYSKHNVNALLRSDSKTRAEFYRLMKEIGVYTTNNILALEDENGIGPEGDQRFVPVNWQPADDLMTGAEGSKASKPDPAPVAPTMPKDEPPATIPMPKKRAMGVLQVREMARHLLSMLGRKETNEANRAAKKPVELFAWLDGFYPAFEELLADALLPVGMLWYRLKVESDEVDAGIDPAKWAADWCAASREQLLDALDGPAEGWPNRSAALFASWEKRPAEVAAELIEESQ